MRDLSFIAITLALLLTSCAPAISTTQEPIEQPAPIPAPTATKTVILEDPPACAAANVVYDPGRERIVLYGGFASDRSDLDDTWEWDGSQWHCPVNCGQ